MNEGRGNVRCEHGDTDRDNAGKCRICTNERKRRWREKQPKPTPAQPPVSRTGTCHNPLPWLSFVITPSEDGGANRKPAPIVKGNDNAHAAVREFEREMRRMIRGMK